MRIDSHAHGQPSQWKKDPQLYIEQCRKDGIDGLLLIAKLEDCLDGVKRFGDFVIPVLIVNIDRVGVREIEDGIRAGCKGIKFIQPRAPYSDERYWPLYETLEKLGVPAVFHTGYLMMFEERELHPTHIEHMRAAEICTISRRFPDLKILMAHFSNPWWEEAWKISTSRPNVYVDLSGGTAYRRAIRMWAEMYAPDGNLLKDSIGKLCFGTDVSYFHEKPHKFAPYIAFYEKLFDAIGLDAAMREQVNSGNIRKLFLGT